MMDEALQAMPLEMLIRQYAYTHASIARGNTDDEALRYLGAVIRELRRRGIKENGNG